MEQFVMPWGMQLPFRFARRGTDGPHPYGHDHYAQCADTPGACQRCHFLMGCKGQLTPGRAAPNRRNIQQLDEKGKVAHSATFELNGVTKTWLCTRAPTGGSPWGYG